MLTNRSLTLAFTTLQDHFSVFSRAAVLGFFLSERWKFFFDLFFFFLENAEQVRNQKKTKIKTKTKKTKNNFVMSTGDRRGRTPNYTSQSQSRSRSDTGYSDDDCVDYVRASSAPLDAGDDDGTTVDHHRSKHQRRRGRQRQRKVEERQSNVISDELIIESAHHVPPEQTSSSVTIAATATAITATTPSQQDYFNKDNIERALSVVSIPRDLRLISNTRAIAMYSSVEVRSH